MCIVLQDYKGTMPRDLISDFFIFTYIHNTHTYLYEARFQKTMRYSIVTALIN